MSENEKKKPIHIVFQILNFIFSLESSKFNLTPIDQLLLLSLAKHTGSQGTYPSLRILRTDLKISERYLRERIKIIEQKELISLEKRKGKKHIYHFLFLPKLSTDPAAAAAGLGKSQNAMTPQLQFRDPAAIAADIYKTNNQLKSRERRLRKKRAPLSLSWFPPQSFEMKLTEVAKKSNISVDELIKKFKNLQLSTGKNSLDWNAEFENFLINERPSQKSGSQEIRAPQVPEWGPGHPSYDSLNS